VAWWPAVPRGSRVAVAVADGHGGPGSYRSDIGAGAAVSVALEMLREWLSADGDVPNVPDFLQQLVRRWQTSVTAHAAADPLPAVDAGGLEIVYGATLLFAGVGPRGLVVAQLGDGDVLFVSNDGHPTRPFTHDPRLVANETTSLCSPDAWREFRLTIRPKEQLPALCILSTDGYFNSFVDEDAYLQVGGDILQLTRTRGLGYVERLLPTWLTETTRLGAGDDVTLAVLEMSNQPATE
jgi:hypothetical protein